MCCLSKRVGEDSNSLLPNRAAGVIHNLSPTGNRFHQLASSALTGYPTAVIALDSYL